MTKSKQRNKTSLKTYGFYALFVLAVFFFESIYLYRLRADEIESIQKELSLISQSKAEWIYQWRAERIADGTVLTTNYNLTASIDRFLKNPNEAEDMKLIQSRIDNYIGIKRYRDVLLVDTLGFVRLPKESKLTKLGDTSKKYLEKALSHNQIILSDFHIDIEHNIPCLDVIAPIYINPTLRTKGIGALVFRIDPNLYLYDLLKDMPTSAKSYESYIFSPEHNQILYKSELKFKSDSALNHRLPINSKDLIEAKALKRNFGHLEGRDYRNKKVIAAVLKVKDSPWYLVAKIDKHEALYQETFNNILIIITTMFFLILILIYFQWRLSRLQQENLKQQIGAKAERQALLKHFEYLFKYANDVIILSDESGNIIEVNGKAEKIYGYTHDEFLAMKIEQLIVQDVFNDKRQMLTIKNFREGIIYESTHLTKQGQILSVEVSSRLITADDKKFYQRIIRDITDRKKTESAILSQSRIYNVLSLVNQAVMRLRDKQELFTETCKIAVEEGMLPLAVVVTLNEETSLITIAAYYGNYDGYLDNVRMSVLDEPAGRGPIANAITYDKVYVINDIESDPSVSLWKDESISKGYYSNAIFPIHSDNKVIGAFLVYSNEKNYFHSSLVSLFTDLALDISWGLEFINNRNKLTESEATMRSFFDSSSECFIMLNRDFRVITFNNLADNYIKTRFGKKLNTGDLFIDYFPIESKENQREILENVFEGKSSAFVKQVDFPHKAHFFEYILEPVYINSNIEGVSITVKDVTEKQQAEIAEQEYLNKLEYRVSERTKQLQLANKELESFSYSVSHDLRAPLRTISGFAQALEEDCGETLTLQALDYLSRIRKATENMTQLIDDVLNLSRVTTHLLNKEEVNLSNLVKSHLHEYITENPNRKIITKIKENILVEGDPKLLSIAFRNLIDNAVKFSEHKKETVIEFGADNENDSRILYIKDNGEGFDMKYVDRLFTPFQRLHQKEKFPGTGVGLSIVQRIIMKHSGDIWFESNPEIGTTAFIRF